MLKMTFMVNLALDTRLIVTTCGTSIEPKQIVVCGHANCRIKSNIPVFKNVSEPKLIVTHVVKSDNEICLFN